VRDRIARAAETAQRRAEEVCLVAVSKTQTTEALEAALDAGQRVFGENRVQEAQAHWSDRRKRGKELRLHLIGPLQSNKVTDAVRLFDVIETLDRPRLVEPLARAMARLGRRPRLLIQVNTGREPQKAGVLPEDLDSLLHLAREAGLRVDGLMAIPPVDQPPRTHFRRLAEMTRERGLADLSMGMSEDFEAAIAEGATHVRVGSALFGERKAGLSGSRDHDATEYPPASPWPDRKA